MYRGFVVLPGWADAFTLPVEVLTQLEAPTNSPTQPIFELFPHFQSTFSGENTLRAGNSDLLKPFRQLRCYHSEQAQHR